MRKTLLTLFIFYSFIAEAQKEANHWYFGINAGLDFTAGAPVADINGALVTDEGCSSISDANGQLLFYTDGVKVYNSNHIQMPNGFGLNGHPSSSQSALIVKKPGALNLFYIFTTDAVGGINGLCYSIVDMTLQAGLGDVSVKNQQLTTPVCEHLTATYHSNGMDVWVMAQDVNTNTYYAYLVSSAGVAAPVVTSIGTIPSIVQASMKFSPAGDKLACPYQGNMFYEVYDFDNSTGILSNVIQLSNSVWQQPFSVEFSPSGKYLYAAYDPAGTGVLLQFDLSLGTQAAITASAVTVGGYNSGYFGSLQLGPDKKLYAGEQFNTYVGVVNYPDSPGVACNFVANGVFLGGMTSNYGLPNFITTYFSTPLMPVALFTAPHHICPGTCTNFTNLSLNGTSYLWTFTGANPSTSTDINPLNICYNTPGNYSVSLITTNVNGSDTITLNNYITVYPYPAPQGIAQSGDSLIANAGAVSYKWYHNGILIPGATDYFYVQSEGGDFNVVATDANGCEVEAVIFDVPMGVQFEVSGLRFEVYPNPVGDKLVVSSSEFGDKEVSIKVYDMIGAAVNLRTPNSKLPAELDVRALPQGMYYLEVTLSQKIFRIKFIKQ